MQQDRVFDAQRVQRRIRLEEFAVETRNVVRFQAVVEGAKQRFQFYPDFLLAKLRQREGFLRPPRQCAERLFRQQLARIFAEKDENAPIQQLLRLFQQQEFMRRRLL